MSLTEFLASKRDVKPERPKDNAGGLPLHAIVAKYVDDNRLVDAGNPWKYGIASLISAENLTAFAK